MTTDTQEQVEDFDHKITTLVYETLGRISGYGGHQGMAAQGLLDTLNALNLPLTRFDLEREVHDLTSMLEDACDRLRVSEQQAAVYRAISRPDHDDDWKDEEE